MPHSTTQPPPFPDDAPVARTPRVSLAKLLAGDEAESKHFFETCKSPGVMMLDLRECPLGERLLKDVDELYKFSVKLFGLPDEEKDKYEIDWGTINGYKRAGAASIDKKGTIKDRCEFYTIGRDTLNGMTNPRPEPQVLRDHEALLHTFIKDGQDLTSHVFSHMEKNLELPAGLFDERHRVDRPSNSQVRLIKYPAQPQNDRRASLFSHTDLGTLTILFFDIGGLQFLEEGVEETEENWKYAKPIPGHVAINVADVLSHWTNGLFVSPRHRVVAPPGQQADWDRYSVSWFARAQADAPMHVLKESPHIEGLASDEEEESLTAAEWQGKCSRGYAVPGTDFKLKPKDEPKNTPLPTPAAIQTGA